jgi:hypothetical protein
MTFSEGLDDRRRAQEEDYFRRQNQGAIERMKQGEEQARRRQELAEASGIADENFLNELQKLGFKPETLRVLPLLPLLETAWAEGRVQGAERKAILETAAREGITSDHEAYAELERWLGERPSEEFFESARLAYSLRLQSLPEAEREAEATRTVAACVQVARAAGGLGFINLGNRISEEEHLVLERIIGDLASEGLSPQAVTAAVGGP